MAMHVALLRGVNVGGAKRVPMARFQSLLSALGHDKVKTLLSSGNAVFRAAPGATAGSVDAQTHRIADDIARSLKSELGFEVKVIVKSADALAQIVAENPFAGQDLDPARLFVSFASDEATLAALAPISALAHPPDGFALGSRAAYAHCPGGSLASPVGAALLGKLGLDVTTRNWATTLKLLALTRAE